VNVKLYLKVCFTLLRLIWLQIGEFQEYFMLIISIGSPQVKLQRWRLHISTLGIKTDFHGILSTFSYFNYFLNPFVFLVFHGFICVSIDNPKIIVPSRLGCGLRLEGE